jgi:hypothetical protein
MKHALIFLLAAWVGLLAGCEQTVSSLEPGRTTLPQLLEQMGQPSMVWSEGDGGLQMEFSRLDEQRSNFMARVSPQGTLVSLQQVLTPANVQTLQGGMTQDQVRRHLGRPAQIDKTPAGDVWYWPLAGEGGDDWQVEVHFGAGGTLVDVQSRLPRPGHSTGKSNQTGQEQRS